MLDETLQLDAHAYERRSEASAKPNNTGALIRIVVIAAMLVLAGGAIALNTGNTKDAAQPTLEKFAAANPKQIEPKQLTPKLEKPAASERLAKIEPNARARPAGRTPAAKPRPVEAPTPPPATLTPPPARTIPEIAPNPSEIAPEAAAPTLTPQTP
jgi:hypothetical protein